MSSKKKTAKKKTQKLPKTKKVVFKDLNPAQGMARFAVGVGAPEGYVFHSMNRKGTTATITYVRDE